MTNSVSQPWTGRKPTKCWKCERAPEDGRKLVPSKDKTSLICTDCRLLEERPK